MPTPVRPNVATSQPQESRSPTHPPPPPTTHATSAQGVFESTGSLTSKGVIPFQIRATEGTVLITNEKTGRVRSAALAPNVMTGAGCSLSADGGDVVLSCPKTVMSHPIVADSITAIVQVKGPLTARGAVSAGRMVNV